MPRSASRQRPLFELRVNRENAMRHLQTGTFNRRSVLLAARRAGTAVAAANLLSAGPSTLGLGSLALARTPETLLQPPEIRSANGILQTTITAASGQMRIGDREFSGLLYDDAYIPPLLRASARRYDADSLL